MKAHSVLFKDFENKTLVIDINVYLYKFKGDDALLEKIYLMCGMFRKYNITPIFVFDGQSPKIKSQEREHRYNEKKTAEEKYKKLRTYSQSLDDSDEKLEIKKELHTLKKCFTRITREEIVSVKDLINKFGMTYIVAPFEADDLCAYLCISGKAYACLSEDTDMFVYGCPRILRYIDLNAKSAWLYNYDEILDSLHVSNEVFKQLCILSGTDYNVQNKYSTRNIFYYYKQLYYFNQTSEGDLFQYFCEKKEDIKLCNTIYNIYDIKSCIKYDHYDKLLIENTTCNMKEIQNLLKPEHFYFV